MEASAPVKRSRDSNLEARRPENLILNRGLRGLTRIDRTGSNPIEDFCFSFITLSLYLIREIRVIRGNLGIRN